MPDYPNIPGHTIEKRIGRGGMGEVFLGVQHSLGRSVALKVTLARLAEQDKNFVKRFVQEARTTARLRHPNIITIYDTGEVGDRCYMTMEYIVGGSLKEKIQEGVLEHEQILAIAKGICEGLSHAHKAGFVHRDIKPENIMLTADGRPVVMDFGIVKVLRSNIDLTGTQAVGSPKYMSPEQLTGDSLIDGRADLYSLGVVMFEMLEGKPPFLADAGYAIGYKHLNEPPPNLSLFNNRFQYVITRLLEKERANRFPTADDLLKALIVLDFNETGQSNESAHPTPGAVNPKPQPVESMVDTDNDATRISAPRPLHQARPASVDLRPSINDVSRPGPSDIPAFNRQRSARRTEHRPFIAAEKISTDSTWFAWLFSARVWAVLLLLTGFAAFQIFLPDISINTLHLEAKAFFGSAAQQYRIAMDLAEREQDERSRFWLSKANSGGVAGAGYELGVSYRFTNEEKAAAAWQSELDNFRHDSHDLESALMLGQILCNGRDYEDCQRAVELLEDLVANTGNQRAMYRLGDLYFSQFEPPDFETARSWFERTIELDGGGPPTSHESEAAMLIIATMYDEGQGETRSRKRATNWIVRAAQGQNARTSTRDNARQRCANASLRSSACDGFAPR